MKPSLFTKIKPKNQYKQGGARYAKGTNKNCYKNTRYVCKKCREPIYAAQIHIKVCPHCNNPLVLLQRAITIPDGGI